MEFKFPVRNAKVLIKGGGHIVITTCTIEAIQPDRQAVNIIFVMHQRDAESTHEAQCIIDLLISSAVSNILTLVLYKRCIFLNVISSRLLVHSFFFFSFL